MHNAISLVGKYECFRTTYGFPIKFENEIYSSVETAYQAQKCPSRYREFLNITPSAAVILGHKVTLRNAWHNMRFDIMLHLNIIKFSNDKDLRDLLLSTDGLDIIDLNRRHSNYWGICSCNSCIFVESKQNALGDVLMKTREAIRRLK